ncbi:hypothetical protein A3841_05800 [Pontibacter flavimaris]|uniref:Uncharacterized protein n=1 Tax=Pontibacter flavimaris TaxID=1797110 RepID=A0A1Q5P8Y1_9BACT|nr:hypothetical protein A3841_05800 [Pontibacter flavimaris]
MLTINLLKCNSYEHGTSVDVNVGYAEIQFIHYLLYPRYLECAWGNEVFTYPDVVQHIRLPALEGNHHDVKLDLLLGRLKMLVCSENDRSSDFISLSLANVLSDIYFK